MGMVALGATLVGTALSARAQRDRAEGIEQVGEANAQLKEAQADYTLDKLGADVAAQRKTFRMFRGKLKADQAAQGGSTSEGTGLLLAQEAVAASKLDEWNIATDALNRSKMIRAGAEIDRYESKVSAHSTRLGALATQISGFGKAAGMAAEMWG